MFLPDGYRPRRPGCSTAPHDASHAYAEVTGARRYAGAEGLEPSQHSRRVWPTGPVQVILFLRVGSASACGRFVTTTECAYFDVATSLQARALDSSGSQTAASGLPLNAALGVTCVVRGSPSNPDSEGPQHAVGCRKTQSDSCPEPWNHQPIGALERVL